MNTDILRRILMDAPGDALCTSCLGTIGDLSADAIQRGMSSLVSETEEFERGWVCAHCHRHVTSVLYRAKCAHCSRPLLGGDKGFRMGEGLFHVACLRRLVTDDSIRLSRTLGRRSRRLIEQSRRRMRQGHGWPPLESP